MKIRLYLDEDSMRHALVHALRARGVDVQTALEAGLIETPDEEHLKYATNQGRVLYSFNVGDFFALHSMWTGTSGTTREWSLHNSNSTRSASSCGDC